ncbi:cohesin domain-containing protein [Sporohalobacter salinus]|uniref:cohesin domain-containing protein n=1 Tax=Sporohalobacter salinus TaxID=1494606 RepID=UPI00196164F8|nr:cohesin domain-containing protein [Sporohalobacter salinus]MBM7623281.1 hypothetical protein [Sporohalobacter salinus]
MKDRFVVIIVIVVSLLLSTAALASVDEHGNLQIKNDYISIVVNQEDKNNGRFAVDVTGGDPMHENDNGKPLIYGRPKPWTSYTTIKIDDTNYIFGGKTDKRAGKLGKYGKQIKAPYLTEQGAIETVYKYGNIKVIQSLSFVKSNTTGLPDTAQIKYKIENNSDKLHKIGLRIMLDTMLGNNDGAPFRVGANALKTDRMYTKDKLPMFWQAFDNLDNAQVVAQGTVKGNQVTAPDKLYVADWGSLADGIWNFNYNPGEEFMRKGEFQLDSALALFWESASLPPGETRTYVTNYGLGGITTVPGLLSLGVSSPAEVILDKQNKSFPVIAYVQNTADIEAKEAAAELNLPNGLTLASNESKKKSLGNLKPGSTSQIVWQVVPKQADEQELEYNVKVTAENTDDNSVSRSVTVIGPPKLDLSLSGPEKLKIKNRTLDPNPFKVITTVSNKGASTAYDPTVSIVLPPGLKLVSGEKRIKYLGYLEPNEEVDIPWMVESVGIQGDLPYAVEMKSINTNAESDMKFLHVPKLKPAAYLQNNNENIEVGNYLTVYFKVANIEDLYRVAAKLKYDQDNLDLIYASRGTLFVHNNKLLNWEHKVNRNEGMISLKGNIKKEADVLSDTVGVLYFKVKRAGPVNISFKDLSITNEAGQKINYNQEGFSFIIDN